MYKVIIWGIGNDYHEAKNIIDFEIVKGNFEVLAMVSKDRYANFIDGKKVIEKQELNKYDYDYIVVFASKFFTEIKQEAIELGIDSIKVINGDVFKISCFDFKRYVSLIENPVTIISDDCFGGLVYNYLQLKMTSPFVNLWLSSGDLIKCINDVKYYLNQPLVCECEGNICLGSWPLASLGEGDKKIILNFNHHATFESACKDWERRKERINFNRIFVKMALPSGHEKIELNIQEKLDEFEKLPYNKICFHPKSNGKNVISLPQQFWIYNNKPNVCVPNIIGTFSRDIQEISKQIDILKLLCGEKDYMRQII